MPKDGMFEETGLFSI